jgi:hypothetical protein
MNVITEEMLGVVFYVGSALGLYNKDPRLDE